MAETRSVLDTFRIRYGVPGIRFYNVPAALGLIIKPRNAECVLGSILTRCFFANETSFRIFTPASETMNRWVSIANRRPEQ